jgi:hypothetical protein
MPFITPLTPYKTFKEFILEYRILLKEAKRVLSSENERKRERVVDKPRDNPYTIDSNKNNPTSLNSENNKNMMIEESNGVRAIGGA